MSIRLSLLTLAEIPFLFFLFTSLWLLSQYESQRRLSYLVGSAVLLAGASAIRYESWLLTLLLPLLFVKEKKHALIFLCVAASFPLLWVLGNWWMFGDPISFFHSAELNQLEYVLPLRVKFTYQLAIIVFGLTPLVVWFVLWGLYRALSSPRLMRCAVLGLVIAAFTFWNVSQESVAIHARYVLIPVTFFIPYAGLGLDRLLALVPSRTECYLLVGAMLVFLLCSPYLLTWSGIGAAGGDLRPIPRADAQSGQVIAWLKSHVNQSDRLLIDHMDWREPWIAFAVRRNFDPLWITPTPFNVGHLFDLTSDKLASYVQETKPRYIVYSSAGSLVKVVPTPCPSRVYQPVLRAVTELVFSAEDITVCKLAFE